MLAPKEIDASNIFTVNEKPISVNKMFIGKKVHTPEYRSYRDLATMELWSQVIAKKHKIITGYIRVHISFYTKNFKKMDIDNHEKAFLDSCTDAGVWKDDRQIIEKISRKIESKQDKTIISIDLLEI